MPDKKRRIPMSKKQSELEMQRILRATDEHMQRYAQATWLKPRFQQKFRWHSLFVRTMDSASSIIARNISVDLFNAYMLLGTRWFSHQESIERLLMLGRYGDCLALLRSLLDDTDLLTYFSLYPEDATPWFQKLGRAPVLSDDAYREGISQFSNKNVWRRIKKKKAVPLGQRDFALLSAAVHSTPWGTRWYGTSDPGQNNVVRLSLYPIYDSATLFTVGLVLQETLPRPIEAFIQSCRVSGVPKSEFRSIETRHDELIDDWDDVMRFEATYKTIAEKSVKRVANGEDPELVAHEMEVEILRIYSEGRPRSSMSGSGSS